MKTTAFAAQWDRWCQVRTERGRAVARRRLTDLLCSGRTMCEALDEIAKDNVTLGIHARDVAEEERGWSAK